MSPIRSSSKWHDPNPNFLPFVTPCISRKSISPGGTFCMLCLFAQILVYSSSTLFCSNLFLRLSLTNASNFSMFSISGRSSAKLQQKCSTLRNPEGFAESFINLRSYFSSEIIFF
ncbi:hypothetical protein FGO68_gene15651 [Halteria grandinella]|uniref:Uncharacterized protein n=1 Tax=Halteria grandinella TaxID=5974 RepID=A0A8J8NDN0_HALGN|nr:hypothetical protein FGO68_gene15651 [Halteria grandinella]